MVSLGQQMWLLQLDKLTVFWYIVSNAEVAPQVNLLYGGFSEMEDSNDKLFGILSYLGILWLVGLLAGKTEFTKFHANQGLVLFIADIIVGIAAVIPFVGWFIIGPVGGIAVFVFMILGIVNAAQGNMKPLPLIGKIQIIK